MSTDPSASAESTAAERTPEEQADLLADRLFELASAAGVGPVREPIAKEVRAWSGTTVSMAAALLDSSPEVLAPSRAAIMVMLNDEEGEVLVQVFCLEPEICERNIEARWKWAMLEDYDADEQVSALSDAVGSTAVDLMLGIKGAAGEEGQKVVARKVARSAALHLLHDTLWLTDDDDTSASIEEVARLDPEEFDRLTRALWPIRVTQSGDRCDLTLQEMEYIAALNAKSPDLALKAAEFFRDRAEVDAAAFAEYAGNGTPLADGVL